MVSFWHLDSDKVALYISNIIVNKYSFQKRRRVGISSGVQIQSDKTKQESGKKLGLNYTGAYDRLRLCWTNEKRSGAHFLVDAIFGALRAILSVIQANLRRTRYKGREACEM